MGSQVIVGELVIEDKEAVRQLLVESYQQYESAYKDPAAWQSYTRDIRAAVDNPNVDKILVAKKNSTIVGTMQLFRSSEKAYGKPELEIESPIIRLLAVHPSARGIGVAQALLMEGVSNAQTFGATAIYLHTTDAMHKAIQLYEKFGFRRDVSKEFMKNNLSIKCYRFDLSRINE